MALFEQIPILVRGGGDLASGVIYRLHRAGFPVMVTELETPLFVRRAVAYGDAVYSGIVTIEGITARRVDDVVTALETLAAGDIPVLVDPEAACRHTLRPAVLVDARMEKVNPGTTRQDAPLVIGLGPGYTAGVDCHAVIETNRGHYLGRVIIEGTAEADTGAPGVVNGKSVSRVLRAPCAGHVEPLATIGDSLDQGHSIARIGSQTITAPFSGVLRGLIHERVNVSEGIKIGDLDPRARRENCFTISDKSLAVGGGVLEAVFSAPQIRPYFVSRTEHETSRSV